MPNEQSGFPPIIRTERLLLRPFRLDDAPDVFSYASDDEVSRYMTWDTHRSIEDSLAYIRYSLDAYAGGHHYDYAFELAETGRVIGGGGAFKDLEDSARFAEIGYVLHRDYWGRGLVPEAMSAFLRFLFEEKGIHRVEAYHFEENRKSGRVMEKIGMRYEGTHRDKYFVKGAYRTICTYAAINPAHEEASV
ncbi:MAG: GNAT family N-acetyltransferase [Clostridia bacterium]|nr:GNAT family N-acetyltransferase [Clostridia bacterium]